MMGKVEGAECRRLLGGVGIERCSGMGIDVRWELCNSSRSSSSPMPSSSSELNSRTGSGTCRRAVFLHIQPCSSHNLFQSRSSDARVYHRRETTEEVRRSCQHRCWNTRRANSSGKSCMYFQGLATSESRFLKTLY
jgi:hypothetical protein